MPRTGLPDPGQPGPEAVRLFPRSVPGVPDTFPANEIHRHLNVEDPPEDLPRPQVLLNAVSSVDGRVAVDGRSGGIGSAVDRATMRNLRTHVDAVIVGAASLRAEKMDLGVPRNLESLRLRHGLEPQPTGIILSRSGDLPLQNLVGASRPKGNQEIIVLLGNRDSTYKKDSEGDARQWPTVYEDIDTEYIEGLLSALKTKFAVNRLLLEGGPTLNHTLVSAGCLDELFITLSPKLLAGRTAVSPPLISGPGLTEYSEGRRSLCLASLHVADSEMFLHYSVHNDSACNGKT